VLFHGGGTLMPQVYFRQVQLLGETLVGRQQRELERRRVSTGLIEDPFGVDQDVSAAGALIVVPAFASDLKVQAIEQIVEAFKVDVAVILDDDDLLQVLKNKFHPRIKVLKSKKPGGKLDSDEKSRWEEKANNLKIDYYFNGRNKEINNKLI